MIAYLYLTYDNPIQYIDSDNIFIHPKFPKLVNDHFKKYIINDLVTTEWGSYSIVQATLNLLKQAFFNKNNKYEWFILLSQDSYLLYDLNYINNFLNKHSLSFFNFKEKIDIYYKSSQWFILNRKDVKIILDNVKKYKNNFTSFNYNKVKNISAYDEIYFLSILKWNSSDYEFNNIPIMYDRWLTGTIQKSPAYFNRLTDYDHQDIINNKSLFIRKISPSFTIDTIKINKKLCIINIGSESDQKNILKCINHFKNVDIILLLNIKIELIDKEIIKKALHCHNIIYKFFKESVKSLCLDNVTQQWKHIYFISENFNMLTLKNIKDKLITVENTDYVLKDIPDLYYFLDNNNNKTYYFHNKI